MSTDLHEKTERLNEALLEAALALKKLNLGVYASVPLTNGWHLHFGKRNGAWSLYASRTEAEVQLLANTPRSVRLEAVDALDDLLARMVGNAEDELGRVELAITQADAFIQRLQADPRFVP